MKTQGERLIAILKRQPMTQMEILKTGISTSWHNRVVEQLGPDEELTWVKVDIRGSARQIKLYSVVSKKLFVPKTEWRNVVTEQQEKDNLAMSAIAYGSGFFSG